MTFTIENFEAFVLIFVRLTGFVFTAPFFSLRNIPRRVKAGLSIFMTAIVFYNVPYAPLEYASVIEYSAIIIKEALAGAIMGFFANIAYQVVSFAGQMIDTEIGFSMVNEIDPTSQVQTTITANLYGYAVLLIMLVTNLHHYFIRAISDSFQIIPLGRATIDPNIYELMKMFVKEYFIIGFRIVLPVFAAILVVNAILAILSKIAPQMNMFVIGMQLKIFVGLFVMVLIIDMIPSVADFIFNEMKRLLEASFGYLY
ncbi:MAG TPA: flagellar biosynthetic protein FliR [Clostridiales bacterium]|nr:flagellar biosynthetic protein FliR [Clostridiales bacterium]